MQNLIFTVDDTDAILVLVASVLEDEYRILTMSSAEKMFSLLTKKTPDMILLDIEMPDMNGYEAIVKLKENPDWQNIPVIFLTGYIDDTVLSRGKELGALDIVNKSDIKSSLLNCVKMYMDG